MLFNPSRRLLFAGLCLAFFCLAGTAFVLILMNRRIAADSSEENLRRTRIRPVSFRALELPLRKLEVFGDGRIAGVAAASGQLLLATGSGVEVGERHLDTNSGLPFLRVQSVASWRGTPVLAYEREGWGGIGATGPDEAVSGWGTLHVRLFLESPAGELLIGAREGLYRIAFASAEMERLDHEPVRALAFGPRGEIAAGGETGLRILSGSRAPARRIATPDPWIDDIGFETGSDRLWAATPLGIASGNASRGLSLHPRAGDLTRGVMDHDSFRAVPIGDEPRVARLRSDGSRSDESSPEKFQRLFVAGGAVWADGPSGLWRRDRTEGWVLRRKRPLSSLPLPRVTALAEQNGVLWAGFFDGGLARSPLTAPGSPLSFTPLIGSTAWGVNALLPAGGSLVAATLRGAYRIEKEHATPLEGAGGAFSLAATRNGVVVGYGQGVYFPDRRLLSGFHGLPGNQAYALSYSAGRDALWVGTPSGLGRIDGRRVAYRAISGDGKLPHPWITALHSAPGALLVATYGGGVTKMTGEGLNETWRPFPETSALKVNAGAMRVDPSGRIWIGTQGQGLWRSDRAQQQFERVAVALPSPDVFSLALVPEDAPVSLVAGTDEGLIRIPLLNETASATEPEKR